MNNFFIKSLIFVLLYTVHQGSYANQEKLQNKNAQVLKLHKVAIALGNDSPYILKKPHNILPIEDGTFFVIDDGKVLKFASDGKFIKIIADKGQGPGQASHIFQLYRRDNNLIVNTGFMNKLMVFDFNGALEAEFIQHKNSALIKNRLNFSGSTFNIMAHYEDKSFIILGNIPPDELTNEQNHFDKPVILISEKNEPIKQLFEIPLNSIIVKTTLGKFPLPVLSVVYTSDEQFIYFSNTERYEIKRYNMALNRIDLTWTRKYEPVIVPEELKKKISYGSTYVFGNTKNGQIDTYKEPERKYFVDIKKIFIVNSLLWIMTSTIDKEKGIVFDIFTNKGEYLGYFFLKPPEEINAYDFYLADDFCIFNDYLFITQNDNDDNPLIVKYKILNIE